MKKLLVCLCAVFICTIAVATTINLNWVVDDANYANTTCETGGDLILPATPPAKYGYTFKGWKSGDSVVYGNVTQNGTPTPDNPIYPTFYQNGDLVLRAVGEGNLIADEYDAITGKITRRVGVRVLDGTENWDFGSLTISGYRCPRNAGFFTNALPENIKFFCSHFRTFFSSNYAHPNVFTHFTLNDSDVTSHAMFCISETMLGISSSASTGEAVQAVKRWLAAQYNAGTPVTVYYPLAEPFEEYLE